jgi:hypothetical protein
MFVQSIGKPAMPCYPVYTYIQPVVPPVDLPAVSCIRSFKFPLINPRNSKRMGKRLSKSAAKVPYRKV